jgi:hypothetical protein
LRDPDDVRTALAAGVQAASWAGGYAAEITVLLFGYRTCIRTAIVGSVNWRDVVLRPIGS